MIALRLCILLSFLNISLGTSSFLRLGHPYEEHIYLLPRRVGSQTLVGSASNACFASSTAVHTLSTLNPDIYFFLSVDYSCDSAVVDQIISSSSECQETRQQRELTRVIAQLATLAE